MRVKPFMAMRNMIYQLNLGLYRLSQVLPYTNLFKCWFKKHLQWRCWGPSGLGVFFAFCGAAQAGSGTELAPTPDRNFPVQCPAAELVSYTGECLWCKTKGKGEKESMLQHVSTVWIRACLKKPRRGVMRKSRYLSSENSTWCTWAMSPESPVTH